MRKSVFSSLWFDGGGDGDAAGSTGSGGDEGGASADGVLESSFWADENIAADGCCQGVPAALDALAQTFSLFRAHPAPVEVSSSKNVQAPNGAKTAVKPLPAVAPANLFTGE